MSVVGNVSESGDRTDPGRDQAARRCCFIVLANEKGGSGKSTLAMHLTVALLRMNQSVASIDLDDRQSTFTRYVDNRRRYADSEGIALKLPEHHRVLPAGSDAAAASEADDRRAFEALADELAGRVDNVVIDTPGAAGVLSRAALARADVLVTPLNDSFLDLDVLFRIDLHDLSKISISAFAEAVLAERQARRGRAAPDFAWYVTRNRLTSIGSRNKQDMHEVLSLLARRFHFRLVPGFSERVIYRELFLKGLTVLDLRESAADVAKNASHVHARQEVRELIDAIGLMATAPAARPATGIGVGANEGV
ncbi:MAG: division plane positioning ATPase MipZ [Kiloniellales bacterium]